MTSDQAPLSDEKLLHKLVSTELAEVAKAHGTPRRTILLESAGAPAAASAPLEVADDPCWVLLSATGLLARTACADPVPREGRRAKHDTIVGAVRTTARGSLAAVTSRGRMLRLTALELPTLPATNDAPNLSGGAPIAAYVDLGKGERVVTIAGDRSRRAEPGSDGGRCRQAGGGRLSPGCTDWEVIALRPGDEVVGAVELTSASDDLVFITAQAQLLRFPAVLCARRGAPRAAWRGSGSTRATRRSSSGRSIRAATPSSSPRRVRRARCPGPSRSAQGHSVCRIPA